MRRTALFLALLAAVASAQNVSRRTKTTFSGEHSVWRSGDRPGNSPTPVFIGFPWDIGTSFGKIKEETVDFGLFSVTGSFGLEFTARTTGRTGIEATAGITGGRASWNVGYETLWSYPWVATPGSRVRMTVVTRPDYGLMQTSTPAFQLSLVGVGRANFAYHTRAALGAEIWNESGSVGSTTEARQEIIGLTGLSGAGLTAINAALGLVGMGADFYQPDVRATGTVASDGTILATGSSRFAALEGSLVDMLLMLFPPGVSDAVGLLLEGNFRYGDWGADWKLAKSYVSMDLRMTQNVRLDPRPAFSYDVRGPQGVLASGTGTLGQTVTFEFTMPNGPVDMVTVPAIRPRLTTSVGADIAGTFKVIPLYLSAAGSFGPGRAFDIVCDLAQEYGMGSESLGRMATDEFDLQSQSTVAATLQMRPGDPNLVTPDVFWMNPDEPDARENAPWLGGDGQDSGLVRRVLYPREGTSWVGANARFYLTVEGHPEAEGWVPTERPAELRFDLDPMRYRPGVYRTRLRRTLSNGTETHRWNFPLFVEYGQPRFDGQMFTTPDLATNKLTNRLLADGRDKKIYFQSFRVFPGASQVVAFPDDESADTGVPVTYRTMDDSASPVVEATIPAEVASRYGGRRLRLAVRNPVLRIRPGEPPFRSSTSDGFLHVVVGTPQVDILTDARTGLRDVNGFGGPSTWFLTGRDFTPRTKFLLRPPTGLPLTLRTQYDSRSRVRVQVDASVLQILQRFDKAEIIGDTPSSSVPADANNVSTTIGGIGRAFNVSIRPTSGKLQAPAPGAIARGRNATIEIRGDALMGYTSADSTVFRMNGSILAATFHEFDFVAQRFAYARLTIPASIVPSAGVATITAQNPRASLTRTSLRVENAPPTEPLNLRVNVESGITMRLMNTITYPDTKIGVGGLSYVNHAGIGPEGSSSYLLAQNPDRPSMDALGMSTTVRLETPGLGGGTLSTTAPVYDLRPERVTATAGAGLFDRATNSFTYLVNLEYGGPHRCDGPFRLKVDVLNGQLEGGDAQNTVALPMLGLSADNRRTTVRVRVRRTSTALPRLVLQVVKA